MAKKKKVEVPDTLVSIVLDRSGSMSSTQSSTIVGFNAFIDEQRELKDAGKAFVSLVQFDDQYEPNFIGEPIENVPALDMYSYQPRGMTALLDAVMHCINDTEAWVKDTGYKGRVLFLIITDGYENASHEATREAVAKRIREKEAKDDWSFVFMGANIDSFGEASSLGMTAGASINYVASHAGTQAAWATNTSSLSNYRSSGVSGSAASASYYGGAQDVDAYVPVDAALYIPILVDEGDEDTSKKPKGKLTIK